MECLIYKRLDLFPTCTFSFNKKIPPLQSDCASQSEGSSAVWRDGLEHIIIQSAEKNISSFQLWLFRNCLFFLAITANPDPQSLNPNPYSLSCLAVLDAQGCTGS